MRTIHVRAAVAAALLTAAAPAAAQTVLNFDTIGSTAVVPFSSYGGFSWATGAPSAPNWAAVDIDQECPSCSPTGLRGGRTSGAYVAAQYYEFLATITSPQQFRMVSTQLSSAWRDNLTVQFGGYLAGQLVWSSSEVVGRSATLVTFNSGMIDELRIFSTGGGAPSGGGTSAGAVFDDFTYSLSAVSGVPEPATWALMTLGFGAIGGTIRRRRDRPISAISV